MTALIVATAAVPALVMAATIVPAILATVATAIVPAIATTIIATVHPAIAAVIAPIHPAIIAAIVTHIAARLRCFDPRRVAGDRCCNRWRNAQHGGHQARRYQERFHITSPGPN
jgi:hypothetical protein